jgi:deazaflavin-dependent oxidoreductase (nitroreductase family)
MSSVEERLGAEQYCYLTTTGRRTGQPHEIEIWFAAVGDTIYLMNGGTRRPPGSSDWVRNALADPSVRVRIRAEAFSGEARAVVFDSEEHERARELLVTKYATKEDDLSRWRATAFPVAIALRPAQDG